MMARLAPQHEAQRQMAAKENEMLDRVEPELDLDLDGPEITLPTGRMTDAQYDAERAKLRETYGDSAKEAGVRWEQELARLFARSGWTQKELAIKEGRAKTWVQYELRFGRFLDFCSEHKYAFLLKNLIGSRFHSFWTQTTSNLAVEKYCVL